METCVAPHRSTVNGVELPSELRELTVDLSREQRIRVVGIDNAAGVMREYFLKVTQRKGLVLV